MSSARLFCTSLALGLAWVAPLLAAPKTPDPAVQALLTQLKGRDAHQRLEAVKALGGKREDARVVVPALADALSDREEMIRVQAAMSLASFGPAARPAIPALIRAL